MKVPVVPSLPIIGHSIPFQRDALNFTAGMQKKIWGCISNFASKPRFYCFTKPGNN